MYVDAAVIAGLVTVGLMFAFFGGVGLFIWSDIKKTKKKYQQQQTTLVSFSSSSCCKTNI